jgi:hypothetical protein
MRYSGVGDVCTGRLAGLGSLHDAVGFVVSKSGCG